MSETISIYFEKLGSIGPDYYHETLVYTNSAGEQYLATSYASVIPSNTLGGLSQASVAAHTGSPSDFGVIQTEVAKVSDLSQAQQDHWLGSNDDPYPTEIVSSGEDLSGEWKKIEAAYKKIANQQFSYSPLTQNSNSVASTALSAAGIPRPADTGILGGHWSPASGHMLPINLNKESASSAAITMPSERSAVAIVPGAGRPAARLSDMHICPMFTGLVPHVGGPISGPCSPNVLIGGLPAARVSDMAVCVGPPDTIVAGSSTVLINSLPSARIADMTVHGGIIVVGHPIVLVGG